MNSGLFLSTAASILMLGSATVFAQSYASPTTETPSVDTSWHAPGYAAMPNVGIINMKPGETVSTAMPQDFGSVQTDATEVPAGSFQPLKPGQAG